MSNVSPPGHRNLNSGMLGMVRSSNEDFGLIKNVRPIFEEARQVAGRPLPTG